MSKYRYGYTTYGNLYLPAPPSKITQYPYWWIRNRTSDKCYQIIMSNMPWYMTGSSSSPYMSSNGSGFVYSIPYDDYKTATEWTLTKEYSVGGMTSLGGSLASGSNYIYYCPNDIEKSSVGSGDVWRYGDGELISKEEIENTIFTYAFIQKSTLTELANIARTKSGTTDTKTIEEMKNIFSA